MASKIFSSATLAACGVAAATALLSNGSARAATLFSTSFESPAFVAGTSVANTSNPGAFTPATTSDVTGNKGSATVQTYGAVFATASAAQLVQISDTSGIAATTSAFYFPTLPSISPVTAGTPVIDSVVQIAVSGGAAGGGSTFGLTALDGTAAGNPIADFEINPATGAVTINGLTTPVTSTTFTAPTTAAFLNYELQLNFTSMTATVYEAALGSSAFTTPIATASFETPATTYSTTAIDTLVPTGGAAGTGVAEFDNLVISSNAVPEPVSASVLFGGLVLAGGRRRRQVSAR